MLGTWPNEVEGEHGDKDGDKENGKDSFERAPLLGCQVYSCISLFELVTPAFELSFADGLPGLGGVISVSAFLFFHWLVVTGFLMRGKLFLIEVDVLVMVLAVVSGETLLLSFKLCSALD